MTPEQMPDVGQVVNIASIKGDTVYWNCRVSGLAPDPTGRDLLWVWLAGPDPLRPSEVHAYIPVDEVDQWWPGGSERPRRTLRLVK